MAAEVRLFFVYYYDRLRLLLTPLVCETVMGLYLKRKPGQSIVVEINGIKLVITYHQYYGHGKQVDLKLEGPREHIKITRGEYYEEKKECSNLDR